MEPDEMARASRTLAIPVQQIATALEIAARGMAVALMPFLEGLAVQAFGRPLTKEERSRLLSPTTRR